MTGYELAETFEASIGFFWSVPASIKDDLLGRLMCSTASTSTPLREGCPRA
jgi:hypothetical protein